MRAGSREQLRALWGLGGSPSSFGMLDAILLSAPLQRKLAPQRRHQSFDEEQRKEFRSSLLSAILATDMAKHFEHVKVLQQRAAAPERSTSASMTKTATPCRV